MGEGGTGGGFYTEAVALDCLEPSRSHLQPVVPRGGDSKSLGVLEPLSDLYHVFPQTQGSNYNYQKDETFLSLP